VQATLSAEHVLKLCLPLSVRKLRIYVIGITGGICSGKSSVSQILQSFGAIVVDADKLGHAAYKFGTPCYHKLVDHFGQQIVGEGNEINRQQLGSIVFSDTLKMDELKRIVWPEIRELIIRRLCDLQKEEAGIVVLEAAVMIEAGWQNLVDSVWVVQVERPVAVSRLMLRNSLSEEEALRRINAQLLDQERVKYANVIVENSGGRTLVSLKNVCSELYSTLTKQLKDKVNHLSEQMPLKNNK
jgi:dephospho-CoA kinase